MHARAVRSVALAVLAVLLPSRLAAALCAPSVQGIFPASGIVGTSVQATVPGTGLAGATAGVFGEPGLTVTVQNAADTAVSLQLQIDAAAAPGERIVSLTTPAGTVAVSFTVNPVGGPIVADVTPPAVATQGFGLDLAITGQNLAALSAANVTVSGAGITVAGATAAPDGTLFDVSLDVAADASLGTQALVIASSAGGALLQLLVQRPAPVVSDVSPAAGEVGATVPLTITGTNLTGAALVITSGAGNQGGIVVSDTASSADGTTLTATLTIDAGLSPEPEPRLLIVTTESGQTTTEFFVVAPDVPTLTSIRPGAGEPGETVTVTLRGLNLTGAAPDAAPADLTFGAFSAVDDETLTLEVTVDPGAVVDADCTDGVTPVQRLLSVTTAQGTDTIPFHLVPAGCPFVSALRPPFGNRGASFAIYLDGVNLSTVVPGTGVDIDHNAIVESNAEAIDDQTVRAIFDIGPNANAGANRAVTVTTASGFYTMDAAFRVNVPGQLPTITDVSPHVVDPGTTTAMTITGSNFDGAGVVVSGPGATVSNVVVDPTGTIITFDLTLAPDAPAETRLVIVVTENGIATCGILSSAAKPELRAAELVKTGSVFEVLTAGFRLFLLEFSLNDQFVAGPRTYTVASSTPLVVLTQLQAENVGRAVRDLHFGFVRVRAVTTTNQIGTSDPYRFRR
jgi:hypothetical protein